MKWRWLVLISILLSACAAAPAAEPPAPTGPRRAAEYPDLGEAPELAGDSWLNTSAPLRLAELRGKVVLVDMWTFG